jgi:hypothetical protein
MVWWTEEEVAWKMEYDKLSFRDFEELGIEKEKLEKVLEKLVEWNVVR